jgi:hypothetical protein
MYLPKTLAIAEFGEAWRSLPVFAHVFDDTSGNAEWSIMAKAKSFKARIETAKGAGRRGSTERRSFERRQAEASISAERRTSNRRTTNRRRQIDPTTCEREYSPEEIEFMHAMDQYKRENGRMFPTCSEILEVVKSLGYQKTNLIATENRSSGSQEPAGVTDV